MTITNEVKGEVVAQGTSLTKGASTTTDFETFHAKTHFWGRLTIWSVIVLTLALPLYLSFGLGLHPGWSSILSGFIAYASIVAALWVIEPISYYPVLGVSGTYLAFLTGNIGNMCLPSASIAQSVVGAEPGTKKGGVDGYAGDFSRFHRQYGHSGVRDSFWFVPDCIVARICDREFRVCPTCNIRRRDCTICH